MIKVLSPYYINTPFKSPLTDAVCTSYKIQLFVWDGLKADVPETPSYEVEILNIAQSEEISKVNVSRLLDDFIEFKPTTQEVTGITDAINQKWVQLNVIYTTTDSNDADKVQNKVTDLLTSGYTYGIEGENATTPENRILLSGNEFDINSKGFFNVPVLIEEDKAGQEITVKSYPNLEINYTVNAPVTTDSKKLVQNICIDATKTILDEFIEVKFNNTTVTLFVIKEYKYKPLNIVFQNKEGQQQVLTFFKEKKESISIKSKSFESNRGQASEGNHQFVKYNINAKSKFTASSGFVAEEQNETFKQLLLSERVWLYDNRFIPLNVAKKSLSYKTRLKDRLINYVIEFDYAFSEINNI